MSTMKNHGMAMMAGLLCLGLMACAPAVDLVSKTNTAGPEDEFSRALQVIPALYVNNVTGSNNNPGTQEKPFLTIKKGLEAAKALSLNSNNINVAVHAAPGTYTSLTGETFPINVPANIWLVGDSANKGNGPVPTILKGAGQTDEWWYDFRNVTVLLHESSRLWGFRVTAGAWKTQERYNELVVCLAEGTGAIKAAVINNILYNGFTGTSFAGGSGAIISGNVIEGNSTGMRFEVTSIASPNAARVAGNKVTYNHRGVEINFSPFDDEGLGVPPDFGDGDAESAGNNIFAWNTIQQDFYLSKPSASYVVSARFNSWSTIAPEVGEILIAEPGLTPVITQGAKQAANTPQVWF